MADYPYAQWFDAPPKCCMCGKPAGVVRSFYANSMCAFMCERHASKAIKDAHRRGDFLPDAVLAERDAAAKG